MSDDDGSRREAEAAIEREVRLGRKLGVKDLMAHIAGPGALKGASPVSPVLQAETAIGSWLGRNLADSEGALRAVVHRHLKGSALLLENLDTPLVALAGYFRVLLSADNRLADIVREADLEWGRAMGERPHFERDGAAPHSDDPYTLESVRSVVREALARLPDEAGPGLPDGDRAGA